MGAPRLRRLGIAVLDPIPSPEHRLYERLSAEHGDAAHSRYNALVRRLVSSSGLAGSWASGVRELADEQRMRRDGDC
jgi:hypothetical protein